MTRRRRIFAYSAAGIALIGVLAALIFYPELKSRWETPLGPGLELPTYTPTDPQPTSAALAALVTNADVSLLATQPALTESATVTPLPSTQTPRPYCGGPTVMTVLAIGADSRQDTYLYGLADVIRIARVDFVTPKVTVLSIPRDLWVEIPGIADHYDITHGKLNQAYLYGGEGMGYYDGPGLGPGLLARTLDLNFGLRVEHYGAVNMQTFVRIVDAVGGIDLFLPQAVDGRPIDDKTEDMGFFPAGQHHFTGDEALRFSRIRKKYNDMVRADNQTMVLCALKEKITSPEVIPDIPKIIASFQDNVLTDLSPAQLGQLACLAPRLRKENLIFTSLPEDILEPSRAYDPILDNTTFVWDVDFNVLRELIADFQAGIWPDKPKEPSCP